MSRERFDAMTELAAHVEHALVELGAGDDFARGIAKQIEHKAGSFLPPVSGTFTASLDAAKITTRN